MVGGLIMLGGVVLGQLFPAYAERRRWRREDRLRFAQERRAAYAALSANATLIAASIGTNRPYLEAGQRVYHEIELLAPANVTKAALTLWLVTTEIARRQSPDADLIKRQGEAARAFQAASRADLGVTPLLDPGAANAAAAKALSECTEPEGHEQKG
jgi:hypothetical protein